jgi:hypothetical protein
MQGNPKMIDANILRAVGEVLETHGVTPKTGEGIEDTVARALGLSTAEVQCWVEALSKGCIVEEANRQAGIPSHRGDDALLVTIARMIGTVVGRVVG